MSETKGAAMSETAVERRLRVVVNDARMDAVMIDDDEIAAIDAGREAIALLREWRAIDDGCGQHAEVEYACAIDTWKDALSALLARCEGEK